MAELLDISTRNVYRLVKDGTLPHVRVGRRLYFPKGLIAKALLLDSTSHAMDWPEDAREIKEVEW